MAGSDRPNILWVCTDQQRWDTIRALGNNHIRTPNLDQLAEKGVAFNRAYAQCPICTPSRASLLTGRYPAAHQVQRNGNDSFPESEILLTRMLADAGYHCGLIGKLHLSRAQDRIERRPDDGYGEFYWSHHPKPEWPEGHDYADWLRIEKGLDPQELYAGLNSAYGPGVPTEVHQSTWCGDRALRFIEQNSKRPWLLSINPFDPHPPFDPPQDYLERYDPKTIPLPSFREQDLAHQRLFRNIDQQTVEAFDLRTFDPEAALEQSEGETHITPPKQYDARLLKACYYAQIELLDTQLGRILDALEATGQLERTLLIFCSDHGELLGDHGLLYKGCRFYEALTHVPLLISWSGTYRRGLRSEALVELIDLAPTVLEAAGMAVPPQIQGRSLHALLSGGSDPHQHRSCVVSEYHDALDLPNASHGSMYFDGKYKLSVYHGTGIGELYDLTSDPEEFHDLWSDPECSELRQKLLLEHFDALMATSSAGIERSGKY